LNVYDLSSITELDWKKRAKC